MLIWGFRTRVALLATNPARLFNQQPKGALA